VSAAVKNDNFSMTKMLHIAMSFFVAVAIWVTADQTEVADVTITDVPVRYVGEDTALAARGMMLLESSDDHVTLKLEGSRKAVADLDSDQLHVEVDLSGVVISSSQYYIWEKGNRDLVYDTGVSAFLMEEGKTLKACKEFMSQYDAQEVDLTGCTVEQVLYIINKGLPAIVVLNESEGLLITAYNSELVTYVDGKSEERITVDYATLNQMAAAAGYTFIGYVQ
jgi:hypothetical protein